MRLCRIGPENAPRAAFYDEAGVVPVAEASAAFAKESGERLALPQGDDLLALLPGGTAHAAARRLENWRNGKQLPVIKLENAELLVPVPRPNKIFLLAGNYTEHIKEQGYVATERAETFPYVFMKPPSTTLNHPSRPVAIPKLSPGAIDWELELAVVIGKKCKGVCAAEALDYVAGYTIINDITDRKFRSNPGRKKRERDAFFDWLHGKWFDTFCPCGPCVTSADAVPDPQTLPLKLTLNGQTRQDGSTAQMVFPVAAVIEFIAAMVTLEPGDLISTGTPSGVGNATGTYLKPGDVLHGSVGGIGTLKTRVVGESERET
jgi:2,4-diketo-3-deoxy-L-fuconate hydrolase